MPKRSIKTQGQTTTEYYKTHQPRNQGEITQGRGEHWYDGILDPVRNYFGELAYRVEHGEIIPGKYTIPGIGAAAATMYAAPILADAFGSTALGSAAIRGASTATNAITSSRLFPWLDAGLESLALAKGVGDITNNRISLETPFDLLPATRAVGPVIKAVNKGAETVNKINTVLKNPDVRQGFTDFVSGAFNDFNTQAAARRAFGRPSLENFTSPVTNKPITFLNYGTKQIGHYTNPPTPRFTIEEGSINGTTGINIGIGGKGSYKGLNLAGGEADARLGGTGLRDLKLLMENHPVGTSFSGDPHSITLGSQLIDDFQNFRLRDFYRHFTTNTSEPIKGFRFYDGMSPDAMSFLYRTAQNNPDKYHISYGTTPAGAFNPLAKKTGRNYHIFEAQNDYNAGNITAEEYINIVNNWLNPLGGRPAKVVNGKPYIYQPFLVRGISKAKPIQITPIKITPENASSITPEQWTAAQDAAIARGDMTEAQRLRDLHFATKSKTKITDNKGFPIKTYHTVNESYPADFVEFNPAIEGTHSAIYTSDSPIMSGTYTNRIVSEAEKDYYIKQGIDNLKDQLKRGYIKGNDAKLVEEALKTDKTAREYVLNKAKWLNVRPTPERQKQLYIKLNRPFTLEGRNKTWNELPIDELPQDIKRALKPTIQGYTTRDIEAAQIATGNYDGGIIKNIHDYGSSRKSIMIDRKAGTVYQINNPTDVKLSDAVTYDDNGVRIPLGKRDNFNIKDIRYAIAPLLAGDIGYGAYKNQKAYGGSIRKSLEEGGKVDRTTYAEGGSIHISPSKRGTFTAAATKHGMGVQEFASRVLRNKENYSPAMVKKANFARNASKWNH